MTKHSITELYESIQYPVRPDASVVQTYPTPGNTEIGVYTHINIGGQTILCSPCERSPEGEVRHPIWLEPVRGPHHLAARMISVAAAAAQGDTGRAQATHPTLAMDRDSVLDFFSEKLGCEPFWIFRTMVFTVDQVGQHWPERAFAIEQANDFRFLSFEGKGASLLLSAAPRFLGRNLIAKCDYDSALMGHAHSVLAYADRIASCYLTR